MFSFSSSELCFCFFSHTAEIPPHLSVNERCLDVRVRLSAPLTSASAYVVLPAQQLLLSVTLLQKTFASKNESVEMDYKSTRCRRRKKKQREIKQKEPTDSPSYDFLIFASQNFTIIIGTHNKTLL